VRPLIVLSARSAALAVTIVLAMGLAGGVIRLLPWMVAPEVPWRLSLPFGRLLFGTAVEISVLLGLPLGVALGAATFVERGEARSLGALGSSPERLVASLAGPGLLVVALYVAVASTADPEPPGRLAARLVVAGRASCGAPSAPPRVDVPLVSFTWLCLSGGPRLAGRVPGLGEGSWFTATDLRPSAELGAAALDDLHLLARLGTRVLALHARNVQLVGLPRWGKPLSLSGAARGAIVGATALGVALATAWLIVRRALGSPLAASAAGGGAALATLFSLRAADAGDFSLARYVLVPVSGLLALVILAALLEAGGRIARGGGG
jgi:hypothetical protein